eukprot:1551326-Amphidinium_carterae.1
MSKAAGMDIIAAWMKHHKKSPGPVKRRAHQRTNFVNVVHTIHADLLHTTSEDQLQKEVADDWFASALIGTMLGITNSDSFE